MTNQVVTPDAHILRDGLDADLAHIKKVADLINTRGQQAVSFSVTRPNAVDTGQPMPDEAWLFVIKQKALELKGAIERFCGPVEVDNLDTFFRDGNSLHLKKICDVHLILTGSTITLDHSPWNPGNYPLEADEPRLEMMFTRGHRFYIIYVFPPQEVFDPPTSVYNKDPGEYRAGEVETILYQQFYDNIPAARDHEVRFVRWEWPTDNQDRHRITVAVTPKPDK